MFTRLFLALALLGLLCVAFTANAQQPTRESINEKKARFKAIVDSLAEQKKTAGELDAQIKALAALQLKLKGLQDAIKESEGELDELQEEIPAEEEQLAFMESPARTVLAVADSDTYLIDFNGTKRLVKLHGIYIDPLRSAEITKAFRKRLVKKRVYVRCADEGCGQVYLYGEKTGPSLNLELVQTRLARATGSPRYDVAAVFAESTRSTSSGYGSSRSTPGTDVHVNGYYRKDGTYVRPHTRSAPGSRSGSSGSSRSSGRSGGSRR